MAAYFAFALLALLTVLLAAWRPGSDSSLTLVRAYMLSVAGAVLVWICSDWTLRKVGLGELTFGYGLSFAVIGAWIAVAACFRLSPFWELATVSFPFDHMSGRVRQLSLAIIGLALVSGGAYGMGAARTAYLRCDRALAAAPDSIARAEVLGRISDLHLRPSRHSDPYTCERMLRR
jgi:hypothetical protein